MINIICGHYGCGKTNLCINLAAEEAEKGNSVLIVDMDIVNPYFRSSDYVKAINSSNIELVSSFIAGSTVDTPAISPQVKKAFIVKDKTVFIDLGGDDAGATAMAQFSAEISDYEMIYVINKRRMSSGSPEDAITILREIEKASNLKATCIVNNTHLGVETTPDVIIDSFDYANKVSELTNLPLLYSTAPDFSYVEGCKKIKREVKFVWE